MPYTINENYGCKKPDQAMVVYRPDFKCLPFSLSSQWWLIEVSFPDNGMLAGRHIKVVNIEIRANIEPLIMHREIYGGRAQAIRPDAVKDIAGPYEHCAASEDGIAVPADLMGCDRKPLYPAMSRRIDLNMPRTVKHHQIVFLVGMHVPWPLNIADRPRRYRIALMQNAVYGINPRQEVYRDKIKGYFLCFSKDLKGEYLIEARHFFYDSYIFHHL